MPFLDTEPYNLLIPLPSGAQHVSVFHLNHLVLASGCTDMASFLTACHNDVDLLVNLSRDLDPVVRIPVENGDLAAAEREIARLFHGVWSVLPAANIVAEAEKPELHQLADRLASAGHTVAVFPHLPGGRREPTLITGPLDLTAAELRNGYRMPQPDYVANPEAGAPIGVLLQAGSEMLSFCGSFGVTVLAATSRCLSLLPHGAIEPVSVVFASGEAPSAYLRPITNALREAGRKSVACIADTEDVVRAMEGNAKTLYDALLAKAPWLQRTMTLGENALGTDPALPSIEFVPSGQTLDRGNEDGEWTADTPWTLGRMTHDPGSRNEPPSDDWNPIREISPDPQGALTAYGQLLKEVLEHCVDTHLQNLFDGLSFAQTEDETQELGYETSALRKAALSL